MGGAVARGLVKGGVVPASDIRVADPSVKILEKLRQDCPGIGTTPDNIEVVEGSDVLITAVKPWLVQQVLTQILPAFDCSRQILVSIAAGVDIPQLMEWAGEKAASMALLRAMPNTAIAIRQSMTFLCHNCNATADQIDLVSSVFGALGKVAVIEERLMSAVTALCSCGIAYGMRYVRAATEGGVELGIYADKAKEYVLQTLRGAIELLEATGNNPEVEIDKVTTPGGVTIKGLNAMEAEGFTTSVIEGLKASC